MYIEIPELGKCRFSPDYTCITVNPPKFGNAEKWHIVHHGNKGDYFWHKRKTYYIPE